jgi:hypothetical protein
LFVSGLIACLPRRIQIFLILLQCIDEVRRQAARGREIVANTGRQLLDRIANFRQELRDRFDLAGRLSKLNATRMQHSPPKAAKKLVPDRILTPPFGGSIPPAPANGFP